MNLYYKNLAVLIIIMLMLVMLFRIFNQTGNTVSIGYSDFLSMVENASIMQVTIQGDNISGLTSQGPFNTFAPKDPELIKLLSHKGVKISAIKTKYREISDTLKI